MAWAARTVAPAGEVDLRAARGPAHRLPEPRPRVARRAGARRRRHVPGASRRQHEQPGRPRHLVHTPRQGGGGVVERVSHPRVVDARPRRGHQHVTDVALSERRAARGDVRDRAADRPRRAPSRVRSGGAAPAQPGPGHGAAVSQPARPGLRQRRLRGGSGSGRGTRRLGRVRGAPGRGAPPRPVPRDRPGQLHRAEYRRAARARRDHGRARWQDRRGDRHAVGRAGPRDQLRPARRRMVRRGRRAGEDHRRRHRRGAGSAAARIPAARCVWGRW